MAGGKMWRPLLALCAVLVHGVLVDSVSVNIVNKLGEPLSYDCEAGSYADASMAPPSGTLTDSQKRSPMMSTNGRLGRLGFISPTPISSISGASLEALRVTLGVASESRVRPSSPTPLSWAVLNTVFRP
ncbi:hypothetical protein AXG93_242s1170 [Marchantia polymorpha subsp. ruderalis]|uniref:Uncharacterized protein n=1 Tax=Marchantia polymorpha subsp. ruderalis TaxID=1480154 RepID=A0A176VQ03_MARPO|nr:hypothetical protein AXG93_242s1170 [Marchantia polymorpha subsp. ruderalis]